MRIALISFTEVGGNLCKKISEKLSLAGEMSLAYGVKDTAEACDLIPMGKPLTKWTKEAFENNDALVFIGAVGIAVRAIAPYIKSKDKDPAVISVDEKGNFVISLLSGHLGGANRLAAEIAKSIEAVPIITTATDLNDKFSVDVWAKEQNLQIINLKAVKQVSADILAGKMVYFYYGGSISGNIPNGIELVDAVSLKEKIKDGETCIIVTEKILESLKGDQKNVLQLVPKNLHVGMGCKKGVTYKTAADLFDKTLDELQLRIESIRNLSSIDLKKDEKALIKLSERLEIPFITYSGEELMQVPGEFTDSPFVRKVTGVENVCERAAAASAEGSSIILKKQSLNGVTIAIAKQDICLNFGEFAEKIE